MLAPMHHPAIRHVGPARRARHPHHLQPARAADQSGGCRRQLIGAFARVLIRADGRDARRARLGPRLGRPRRRRLRRDLARRRDLGRRAQATARARLSRSRPRWPAWRDPLEPAILGGDAPFNAAALRGVLAGEAERLPRRGAAERRRGARRRRRRRDLKEGVAIARKAIDRRARAGARHARERVTIPAECRPMSESSSEIPRLQARGGRRSARRACR